MMIIPQPVHGRQSAAGGFSLVEVVLATSLVALFMTAAIVSFIPASRGTELDLGAFRLESVLRFARAEAANTGRRVRVTFVPETNQTTNQLSQIQVSWEPNPIDEPEVFQDLSGTQWELEKIQEGAQVENVRLLDFSQNEVQSEGAEDGWAGESAETTAASQPTPITFNPDGSSDSAEIVLAARDPDDPRHIMVRIMGLTGTISRQVETENEDEQAGDYSAQTQESSPAAL